MIVTEYYNQQLEVRGYKSDSAQLIAVNALDHCVGQWSKYQEKNSSRFKKLFKRPIIPRGVYLYGGVGRGKSFLMDCFFESVIVKRKTRLHFHEFMREVHFELGRLSGYANPLEILAKNISKKFKLICFDEFHISDITDAMILHRLLEALFNNNVGFVTTSNFKPDELYPNGLHRTRIFPAIDLLNNNLDVINVDGGIDYRLATLQQLDLYLYPVSGHTHDLMNLAFNRLSESSDDEPVIEVESRKIRVLRRAGGVIWFDFKSLCGGPRSQNDYLEIASLFHTVLLSDVPKMSKSQSSEARRFTWLIDVLYDRRVKLMMSAETSAKELYLEGPLAHEFPRTVSRLSEMQSEEFLALDRRSVNTLIT